MILGVAIKRNGKGYTQGKPARHCHITKHVVVSLGLQAPIRQEEQGFFSDTDEFLNRIEARQHAVACDQLIASHGKYELFSEDVW